MILPMKKICLVVQNKYQHDALIKLRETGVVHIQKSNAVSDRLSGAIERRVTIENALGLIQPYKLSDKDGVFNAQRAPEPNLTENIINLGKERKTLEDRRAALARERNRIAVWGDFDPEKVKELASMGQPVFLYEFTLEALKAVPQETRYIQLSKDKNGVRLLVLDSEIPGSAPLPLPEKSLSGIDAELRAIQYRLEKIEAGLKGYAVYRPALEREIKAIRSDIEFETARAELEKVEGVPPEFGFSCLSGYVPAEDLGRLKAAVSENSWALMADDPGPEDAVPTKLKNNRFVRLLNPLTDFLEVTPGYREADISGWFLFFFVIFFGMIFGDAAYGAIILIAAIVGIIKTVKKGVPPILRLMLLLGISNFVWGMLTCTWFGVEAGKLPEILQRVSLPLISNVTAAQSARDEGIVRQNLMILCFTLALLQLSIGHIVAISRCKTLKIVGELGSIAMLVGMYGIVLALIASNEYRQIPLLMPYVYLLGSGFVLNFVFTNYAGSIGRSILESLKNFISMVLGIANVFSDIMSYIRLWAVGLAGGAISATVDKMAGPMLGHLAFFIFGVILLVFGHGLNLVLNTLSVLVHGVRLNTLEFSGHVGLTWAGTAYKPFAETGFPPSKDEPAEQVK